tara:strand:- start:429 stop:815 length:387 start_codon:yes stop_codon:yes gene_type:complete
MYRIHFAPQTKHSSAFARTHKKEKQRMKIEKEIRIVKSKMFMLFCEYYNNDRQTILPLSEWLPENMQKMQRDITIMKFKSLPCLASAKRVRNQMIEELFHEELNLILSGEYDEFANINCGKNSASTQL